MSPRHTDDALTVLLAAIDEVRLEHALMGGYAVVTWGVPRATYDVDVLVESSPERLDRCFDACAQRGFEVDEIYRKGWRDRVRDMPLVKVRLFRDGRAVTSDLFLVTTPFQEAAFARRRDVQVPSLGRHVPVVSPADLVLFKLLAARPKDRADVQNVLTVQGVPDPDYLRTWARRLGVEEALDRAIVEAQGPRG